MARKSHKRHSKRRSHRRHSQRGGGDGYFSINMGAPLSTASGAPLESRAPVSFCGWDNGRVAPAINPTMLSQFGGRRRRQRTHKQRGGGCGGGCGPYPPMQTGGGGCGVVYPTQTQKGGGSGNGGFGFELDNTLGKVYHFLDVGKCPPVPVENSLTQRGGGVTQQGGALANEIGIVSYKTGYGYNESSPVSTPSAHYLNQVSYDRTCGQTGGRRRSYKRRTHRRRR